MLITKEVEVTLGVRNIRYYENLGYKIPKYEDRNHNMCVKRGTKINVKIEDLSEGSNVNVEYECDNCHKIFSTRYDTYSKHNDNGKTICPYCIEAPHVMKGQTRTRKVKFKPRVVNIDKLKDYGNNRIRTNEYIDFVKKVLKRDSYECQCCHKSDDLEVHHLDGYNWCIEKRTDDTNGITLCKNCHTNFHIKYGRGNNTKEQYEEWIGKSIEDILDYNGNVVSSRKIICLETKEIDICKNFTNGSKTHIYDVCNGKANHYKNKHYMWYDEYINSSEEEIIKRMSLKRKRPNSVKVICIEKKLLFETLSDAGKYFNRHSSMISDVLNGKQNTFAGYHWCRLSEYQDSISELKQINNEERSTS